MTEQVRIAELEAKLAREVALEQKMARDLIVARQREIQRLRELTSSSSVQNQPPQFVPSPNGQREWRS